MIRYFPLIIIALFLDGLQGALTLSMWGIIAATGTTIGWIPVVGQIAASVVFASGTVMGIALSFCLTVTFGSALIVFLIYNRMFYPQLLIFGGVELIPMINNIPGWTGMVVASMIMKSREEKRLQASSGEAGQAEETEENILEEPMFASPAQFGEPSEEEESRDGIGTPQTQARAPFLAPLQVDGIRASQKMPLVRPDNDNLPSKKYAA